MNPNQSFIIISLFSIAGLSASMLGCIRAFRLQRYASATWLLWIALSLIWCIVIRSALELAK